MEKINKLTLKNEEPNLLAQELYPIEKERGREKV